MTCRELRRGAHIAARLGAVLALEGLALGLEWAVDQLLHGGQRATRRRPRSI